MRKRFRVLILAALVIAVVVPLAVALSFEPAQSTVPVAVPADATVVAMATNTSTSALARPSVTPLFSGLPDGARLLLLGAILFALAAGVKRANYGQSRSLVSAPQAYNRNDSAR